ncbi:hypothetical protein D3C73_663520 [compost metagenome]
MIIGGIHMFTIIILIVAFMYLGIKWALYNRYKKRCLPLQETDAILIDNLNRGGQQHVK